MSRSERQPTEQVTLLTLSSKPRLDEYGESDEWDRGGIYDESNEFDLEATQELLVERFSEYDDELSENFAGYERQHTEQAYEAVSRTEESLVNENGRTVIQQEVRVFPRGPYLNNWCVSIVQWYDGFDDHSAEGTANWLHTDAMGLESIGAAVATGLAVMRDEILPRPRFTDHSMTQESTDGENNDD